MVSHQHFLKFAQNLNENLGGGGEGGGVTFTKMVRGCACRTSKVWLYLILPNFPPISIFNRKASNFTKLGVFFGFFYNNLLKIHPIYLIWAPSSLMKTPLPIAIPNFAKKSPKRQVHMYTTSM